MTHNIILQEAQMNRCSKGFKIKYLCLQDNQQYHEMPDRKGERNL